MIIVTVRYLQEDVTEKTFNDAVEFIEWLENADGSLYECKKFTHYLQVNTEDYMCQVFDTSSEVMDLINKAIETGVIYED